MIFWGKSFYLFILLSLLLCVPQLGQATCYTPIPKKMNF
jgi:hypothetical protein